MQQSSMRCTKLAHRLAALQLAKQQLEEIQNTAQTLKKQVTAKINDLNMHLKRLKSTVRHGNAVKDTLICASLILICLFQACVCLRSIRRVPSRHESCAKSRSLVAACRQRQSPTKLAQSISMRTVCGNRSILACSRVSAHQVRNNPGTRLRSSQCRPGVPVCIAPTVSVLLEVAYFAMFVARGIPPLHW